MALIVLAAGAGTRMRSVIPETTASRRGTSMIEHVLAAAGGRSGFAPPSSCSARADRAEHRLALRAGFDDLRIAIQRETARHGGRAHGGIAPC